jgi:hypothetical protein
MPANLPPAPAGCSDEHRTKIANSQILKCLIEFGVACGLLTIAAIYGAAVYWERRRR